MDLAYFLLSFARQMMVRILILLDSTNVAQNIFISLVSQTYFTVNPFGNVVCFVRYHFAQGDAALAVGLGDPFRA